MSKDFVRPPLEDQFLTADGYITDTWREWFIDTWQTNDELAGEAGIQLPVLTTAQRDSDEFIDQAKVASGELDGLMIYNTTISQGQILAGGVWTNI